MSSTSVPARTRIIGPGISGRRPSSANAGTRVPEAASPSGYHIPTRATKWIVSRLPRRTPPATLLSFVEIRTARPTCRGAGRWLAFLGVDHAAPAELAMSSTAAK